MAQYVVVLVVITLGEEHPSLSLRSVVSITLAALPRGIKLRYISRGLFDICCENDGMFIRIFTHKLVCAYEYEHLIYAFVNS